ncbi:hypothetical protein F5Y16DRAFT_344842 [Xylariaceae sp. FL0255]|nr:hypothetical protein F5Y16DRAFT_344842 [Xylariaceae sp. FL0255]
MHRALSSRWLNNALNITERSSRLQLPIFLCPALRTAPIRSATVSSSCVIWRSTPTTRCLHVQADASTSIDPESDTAATTLALRPALRKLPHQCSGCGALSQTSTPNQPGYYDVKRNAVKRWLGADERRYQSRQEDKIFEDAMKNLDPAELGNQGVDIQALALSMGPSDTRPQQPPKKPVCDRCHFLIHNNTGESIYHPSVDSIRDTLDESPYKYNHVYHVLDAADFPMSLVPKITEFLDTMPMRSRNRRSRSGRFFHGQKTEISFVITRSDLLAPTKEGVDALFPYLREVLRDALGRAGRDVRLGNLRAVSAKRGWWTKALKEDIWKRGGGGWMLGKANVGKSQLFEAVFPKGRMETSPSKHQITIDMEAKDEAQKEAGAAEPVNPDTIDDGHYLDEFSLLPPAPEEVQYPEMPLVSHLSGTTASPIRVPFGGGRGELIDLPGLERTGLEAYVKKEHRNSLLMHNRVVPEQMSIKPGQSLLIGGFIRITPRNPKLVILSYNFTPLSAHITRTDKAIEIQAQSGDLNVENIALPSTVAKMKHAGSFALKWDVTKKRTGPLMRKSAIGLSLDRLPYRVVSTDILIEGVGWVEIVAQVRLRDLEQTPPVSAPSREIDVSTPTPNTADTELETKLSGMERLEAMARSAAKNYSRKGDRLDNPSRGREKQDAPEPELSELNYNWPVVDIYSPEGKFIAYRKPMDGWNLNKPRESKSGGRPRKSMAGFKKSERSRRRLKEAAAGGE